ncbi:MAG: hypothetical protein P9M03_10285 [Candidatus Theseobacter exili]|nr:hypothetical protein [Candidatus Theseobacter exili]
MNIEFPQKIIFRFIEQRTGELIQGLVVSLTLFAKIKNNYHVGPKFSDLNGTVSFSIEELKDEISNAKNMFIMDYKSNLEECSRFIEIKVMSSENIESLILARKKYFSKDPIYKLSDEQVEQLRNSKNKEYLPLAKKIDVSTVKDDENITISLIRN